MPSYKARERLMLRALHRYSSGPEGCSRAWLSLPHSMRVFYVHAYCSRVWNEAASFRLKMLGLKPVLGDLVWTKGNGKKQECLGAVVSNLNRIGLRLNIVCVIRMVGMFGLLGWLQ